MYVAAAGSKDDGFLVERLWVLGQLTKAGIRAAYMRKANPKLVQQFKAAKNLNAPITVILGPDELAAGNVRLKVSSGHGGQEGGEEGPAQDMEEKGEKDRGRLLPKENVVVEVKELLDLLDSGYSTQPDGRTRRPEVSSP